MSIKKIISDRNITMLVHFTTLNGLIGILHTQALKASKGLNDEQSLEHILQHNAPYRSDESWTGYVNLSVSRINNSYFNFSSEKWHPTYEWCIICLKPEILEHDGVHFTTTNNIYSRDIIRAQGLSGLRNMFADTVIGKLGKEIQRTSVTPLHHTTDIEAEVLYPSEISLEFIDRILVPNEEIESNVAGTMYSLDITDIDLVVDESAFALW